MLDLLVEFRSILAALQRDGVECAVCGGLAMAIHSFPRATLDVHLLVPRAHLEPAKQSVRALGYRIEAGPLWFAEQAVEIHQLSKPDPETGDLLSLDLLVVTPALEPVWRARERVRWEHGTLPVVSRSGLARMKRLRSSGQDLADIAKLEADTDGE